jgi:putative transposase
VRLWRTRWQNAAQKWEQGESEGIEDETLLTQIISVLRDEPRRGNPGKFNLEEIVQIIAVACEIPATSDRPVSHWRGHRAKTGKRCGLISFFCLVFQR